MRLIVVRHGQTNHNRDQIALGRDDVPLNDTGLRQADAVAARLASENLAAIYASPLQRARRTAEAIASHHDVDVTLDDGLIEMDVGELDGLTYPTIRERFPGAIERWLGETGPEHPFPGGESLAQVADRSWDTVQRLATTHADQTVAIVSHNFVILCLLTRALGLDLSHFRRLKHEVAAVSIIDFGARTSVLSMNDTCHLEGCG